MVSKDKIISIIIKTHGIIWEIFFKELKGFCIYFSVGRVLYFQEIRRNRCSFHDPFKLKGKEAD